MKIRILEAVRSTPEKPLYCWHVFQHGRSESVAMGFAPSYQAARVDAEAAMETLREPALSWPVGLFSMFGGLDDH
ncbi:MAG: hypothetical protein JW990_09175 [Thermoleophilia bacterium]|nr:hypothetical protein [Thermoleophilia bacterium]